MSFGIRFLALVCELARLDQLACCGGLIVARCVAVRSVWCMLFDLVRVRYAVVLCWFDCSVTCCG